LHSAKENEKAREGWTAKSPLPGGDLDVSAIAALTAELQRGYPFLVPAHAGRLAHAYGTRANKVLGNAKSMADLGNCSGHIDRERSQVPAGQRMACTADDIVCGGQTDCGYRPPKSLLIDDWISAHHEPHRTSLLEDGRADMSVTLEHITRSVDGIPTLRDVSLTLDRRTLSVCSGRPCRARLDHAAARRARQADIRPRPRRWQGRDRCRRAQALGGDGVPAVHQLSVAERL